MAEKEQEGRIFVGGLSADVTERELESAFNRFGKIIGSQIMLERDTGRSRGFGFLTFADRRAVDDAIREMHGREFGDRVISVNKAVPKVGGDDSGHGYERFSPGPRGNYSGGNSRSAGPDECFKCGRTGHWARECPSAGSGSRGGRAFSSPRSRFDGRGGRGGGARYLDDRERYVDDRFDRGRYGDRDHYESRDDQFGSHDRYFNDRFAPPAERIPVDRYGSPDGFRQNGYGKARSYGRDGGSGDRYGGGGGPERYEGRNYRERAAPYSYDRPRRGGRAPSFKRY